MDERREPGKCSSVCSTLLRVDALAGLVLILVGSAVWLQAVSLDRGTMRYLGPGMLPSALALVLLVIGVAVLVAGLRRRDAQAEFFRASLRGPCAIAAALLAFAATIRGVDIGWLRIPQLGLIVAGPLAVVISGYASREANLRDLAALGFGLTAGCAALFDDVLGMTLPVLPSAVEPAAARWIGLPGAARVAYAGCAAVALLIVVFIRRAGSEPRPEEHERA